jgi:hypothetical protein
VSTGVFFKRIINDDFAAVIYFNGAAGKNFR